MKTTIKREVEVEIKRIDLAVAVRYEDEDIPYDFPGRDGEMWRASIDIDTGKIIDYPSGRPFDMHMKVCDCGSYKLIDDQGNVVGSLEDEYVPNGVVPGQYRDYIIINIDDNGVITNWPNHPDLSEFFSD